MNSTVTAVESFRFLGTTISQDLKWDNHIDSIAKKAQQRLYFLRQLRKFNLPQELLKQLYSAIIESVLCSSITVWFGSATKTDIRRLQRTVRTAQRIIGAPLPSLQEFYTSRVRKRAKKVTLDPSHPAHSLFVLLPSVRRYRSRSTKTARLIKPSSVHRTHAHSQFCLWTFFFSVYIFFFITIVIINYCLFSSLLVLFITLIICCLHYVCTFCTGSS